MINRRRIRVTALLLSILLTINLFGDLSISLVKAETNTNNSTIPSSQVYQLTMSDILERFQTTETFVQSQLDQGYSLNEIYNLFFQSQVRGLSYEETRLLFSPSEVNASAEVTPEVYSELVPQELRNIPIVPLNSVTGVVYDEPKSSEIADTVNNSVYLSNKRSMLRASALDAPENPVLEKPPVYSKTSFNEAPYTVGLDNESISTLSGGVSLRSDDLTLPGRNGLSFTLSRQYNTGDAQFFDMGYDYTTYAYPEYAWRVTYNAIRVPVITKYDVLVQEYMLIQYDQNSDGIMDHFSGPLLQDPTIDQTYDTEEQAQNAVNLLSNRYYKVPGDSLYLTDSRSSSVNSFQDTIPPWNGYSGSLKKVGAVKVTGSYTAAQSKVATGTRTRTISGVYNPNGTWEAQVYSDEVPLSLPYSDSDGYKGDLTRTGTTTQKTCPTQGTPGWVCTKSFQAEYSGTVRKEAVDNRLYTQDYGGTVEKAEYYSPDRYTPWTSTDKGRVRYIYSRYGKAFQKPREIEDTKNSSIEVMYGGDFDQQKNAVAQQNFFNNRSGMSFGSTFIEGNETVHYYIASPASASIEQYVIGTGVGANYFNTTSKPTLDKLYPIGKGWSWNLPFVEVKDGRNIIHPGDGGSYTIENGALKESEWQGVKFVTDTSVNVNGEQSQNVLISSDGMTRQYFNSNGLLIQIADSQNNTINFAYTYNAIYNSKLLSQVKDAIDNTIEINYTSETVTLKSGDRTVVYNKHTEEGVELLGSVTDPLGRKTTYSYQIKNAWFNLLSDYAERAVSNPYALLTRVQHPTGAITEYTFEEGPVKRYLGERSYNESYRLSSRLDRIIYKNGQSSEYNRKSINYNETDMGSSGNQDLNFSTRLSDGLTDTSFHYRKDYIDTETPARFFLESSVQSGGGVSRTTSYEYGKYVNGHSYPAQTPTKITVSNNQNGDILVETTDYDDYGNITKATDAQGHNVTSTYDDRHLLSTKMEPANEGSYRFTVFTRNPQGETTNISVRKNNAEGELLQSITFDKFDDYGNILSQTVRNKDKNITVLTDYNATNHAFAEKQTMDVHDAEGQKSTISVEREYDSSTGDLLSATDGKGNRSSYKYDALGRVIEVTHADQSNLTAVYDDLLNTVTVTDENNLVSQTKWNALGWQLESGIFEKGIYKRKSSIVYDAFGRKDWDQDALGNKTQYHFDAWNRLTSTEYPDASKTIKLYDDKVRTVTSTTGEGYSQIETYDKWGQKVKVEEKENSDSEISLLGSYDYNQGNGELWKYTDGKSASTTYKYNDNDELISVTNALSETTQYEYDMLGNLITLTHPDGTKKQYTYNELGERLTATDEAGRLTTYSYDNAGNLLSQQDRNGVITSYEYDNRNRLKKRIAPDEAVEFTYDLAGNRLTMSDNTGTTSYQYEPDTGLLKQVTYPDQLKLQITEYNANGNRTEMTGPFGDYVQYSYDAMNRLYKVGASLENPMVTYSYNKNGVIDQVDTDIGLTHSYKYTGIDLTRSSEELAGRTLNKYEYKYDVNNNIQERIWTQLGGEEPKSITDNFGYDKLNRIETSTENNGEKYTYDSRGNRTGLVSGTGLESLSDREYKYDTQNQLTQALINGKKVEYHYNGDGLLVERIVDGITTRYYYDGNQIIAEAQVVKGQPKLVASYLRGLRLEAIRYADGSMVYPGYNGHGDLVEIRSQQGALLNQYKYDIWGNITSQVESVYNPFRYAGELWDDSTDLQYLRARWYDPSMGRFLNEDTVEGQFDNPLTLNLYTYVYNNPLRYLDPTGNKAWEPYAVNQLRLLIDEARVKTGSSKTNINYQLYKSFIWNYYDFGSFMSENHYNYLYGLLTGTSAYKNSAGNADWARETLIGEYYKSVEAEYVAYLALGAAVRSTQRNTNRGCNCFVAGTKAQTDEGEKNIEDIEVGDKVLSKDEETGEVAYKEVTATMNHETDEIYQIHVGDQVIESTFNHPFYVKDKGWTFVKDLKVGDLLVQSDGNTLEITSIEMLHKHVTVYNMTVDEFHTYFVSDLGIWVHNTNCPFGANGVQVTSKTIWKENGSKARIDVENPNPGQRAGQIHYQDANNNKYLYDPNKKAFLDSSGNLAPKSVNKMLEDPNFVKKLNVGLTQYLGESPYTP
ncbi:type IV secretion protein Rhs [Paenibacillus spiritus]|uniref:Type IV secretion protein Rhs n=1 Tax=Paenibacillus spiritus TaxID=2496557 RepID=A0A5J5G598_9BACL|nr:MULTISPECIES: polymorphic toxin-type HINT domain-containing protein [Paenibacillus]KAA9002428.1 type IV secretion protein Rhs [Paenibacillus spiritus]